MCVKARAQVIQGLVYKQTVSGMVTREGFNTCQRQKCYQTVKSRVGSGMHQLWTMFMHASGETFTLHADYVM